MNTDNKPEEIAAKILKTRSFAPQVQTDFATFYKPNVPGLSLSAFGFVRVYNDGTAFALYSNAYIGEYVVKNQLHIASHIDESLVQQRFWYLPDPNGKYSQILREIKNNFNAASFIDYIELHHGYFDMFCFWSPMEQHLAANYFLNNKQILEHYCHSFFDQAQDFIKFVAQDKFSVPAKMAPNFRGLSKPVDVSEQVLIRMQFHFERVQEALIKVGKSIYPKLTDRELDCLKLLLLGKTGLEIAVQLNISVRTVEVHLNMVKDKIGCQKKSQIISSLLQTKSNYRN